MKGTLHKTERGWQVSHATYDLVSKRWTAGKLPLHPDTEPDYDYGRDMEGEEVEFEIVKEYTDSYTNQVQKYAKLIKPKTGNKVDLQKLEAKFDKLLSEETPESFHKWLESKRGPIRNYHSPKIDDMLKEIEEEDLPTTTSDKIDSVIWDLPFETRMKCWDLIEELVKEETKNLYTEEQVREAIEDARDILSYVNTDEVIKSLKQPKQ